MTWRGPGSVWAPDARSVLLHLPDAAHGVPDAGSDPPGSARGLPLVRADDGWWHPAAGSDPLAHGTAYAFRVDGGPARPDPRSPWQPDGVHRPSRVFDAGRHTWTDAGWPGRDVRGAVVYELHLGTFTPEGTLDAAAGRLSHLVDLGVDLVELLPVAPFDGRHGWGYDGVGLYGVHQPYGGPAALQRFVDAAHRAGLAVCLDVVHNHLGPSGNYLGDFGPYFTDAHRTPWGVAVNLDGPGAEHVRRWIIDSALRWARDFHVDALRLDAVHALADDSPRHLLAQLSDEVRALAADLGRPVSLIAESDQNDPRTVAATTDGGRGMTAQWADDVHHAVHALVTGERFGYYVDFGSPETLSQALTGVFVHDGGWSTFRGRPWGSPVPPRVDGHRFVVFGSDHDQVGNRALGDRPSASLDPGRLAASAALVLLGPFTPMLFMGEEWGARTPWLYFTDHPDPALAEAVRAGRRAEFAGHGWAAMYGQDEADFVVPDPQDPATFAASRLDWSEIGHADRPEHARLLDWYRTLLALRRSLPDLACGDRSATALDAAPDGTVRGGAWRDWLVLRRGAVRVVVNLADDEREVPCRPDPARPGRTVRAAWAGCRVTGTGSVLLDGRSAAVLA